MKIEIKLVVPDFNEAKISKVCVNCTVSHDERECKNCAFSDRNWELFKQIVNSNQ